MAISIPKRKRRGSDWSDTSPFTATDCSTVISPTLLMA